MFTYIYSTKFYKFVKSGMLIDFFFKKITNFLAFSFFYVNNFIFSEKYFVEYMFFRFKNFYEIINTYIESYSNEYTYVVLAIAILSLMTIAVFILIGG